MDEKFEELEAIVSLINLKRRNGDSSLSTYVKYPETIKHLQTIGYDISEIKKSKITKLNIGW